MKQREFYFIGFNYRKGLKAPLLPKTDIFPKVKRMSFYFIDFNFQQRVIVALLPKRYIFQRKNKSNFSSLDSIISYGLKHPCCKKDK